MEGCNSESETAAEPNDSSDEELVEKFTNTLITEDLKEHKAGEWIPQDLHPWGSENKPDPNLKKDNTVAIKYKYKYKFIFLPQNANNKKIKQDSNTKANKSGEEAQKKPWGL